MMEAQIPDKLYFKIGEVAKLIGVEPYVLRYWETEFNEISPIKSRSKQRLYKRQDVEVIFQIRELLHKQKFTIKGAKSRIKEIKRKHKTQSLPQQTETLISNQSSSIDSKQFKKPIKDIVAEMDAYLKQS